MKFEPKKYPNIMNVALLLSLGYKIDSLSDMGDTNNAAHVSLYKMGEYSESLGFMCRESITMPLFVNNAYSNSKYASLSVRILQNELSRKDMDYSEMERFHYKEILKKFENEKFSGSDLEEKLTDYAETIEVILLVLNKTGEINYSRNKRAALNSLHEAIKEYKIEAELKQKSAPQVPSYLANLNAQFEETKREEYLKTLQYALEDVLSGSLIREREQNKAKNDLIL